MNDRLLAWNACFTGVGLAGYTIGALLWPFVPVFALFGLGLGIVSTIGFWFTRHGCPLLYNK